MKMDWMKLKKDIAEVTAEIKMLKKVKRESGQPHWNKGEDNGQCPLDDAQLRRSKDAATRLSTVAAHYHGRVHRAGSTLEEQTKFLAEYQDGIEKTYGIKEAKAA